MLKQALVLVFVLFLAPLAFAYEVIVGLGSTAGPGATIAMEDRSKWSDVAELSWPLANLYPIATLTRAQQEAVFYNFKQRRAIAELPYRQINWGGPQGAINFIESFGFTVPYVFVLDGTAGSSMLTREELERVNTRFPDKKIIMNSHAWTTDNTHIESIKDLVDGICIEFSPFNHPAVVAQNVAPYAEWAYKNNKILLFLMPPLMLSGQTKAEFVTKATQLAQIVYDENKDKLPHGWMRSDQFLFAPANYSFGTSYINYVPEDAQDTVLAVAKALLKMRPSLDAGAVRPATWLKPVLSLLTD